MIILSESKLELRSIEVEGHFCSEYYLLSWFAHHKRQHFLCIGLQLDFQLPVGGQFLILKLQVVHLEKNFLDIGILVHFVLIEQDNPPAVVVCLHPHIYLLPLDLSLLDLGRFLVSQLSQLFQRVLLNNVELNLCRERIITVPFFADLQLDDPLLTRIDLDRKLILLSLPLHLDVLPFLERNCLAEVVVVF